MVTTHHQMLAVIDIVTRFRMDEGIRPSAETLLLFDKHNGMTAPGQFDGSG